MEDTRGGFAMTTCERARLSSASLITPKKNRFDLAAQPCFPPLQHSREEEQV